MVVPAMTPLTTGGISSESQDTPATGPPQASHPTPPRQNQRGRLPTAGVHRLRHPLRDRRPHPRRRQRRHRNLHALVLRRVGLIDAIDRRLHLLKFHFPYHESYDVLDLRLQRPVRRHVCRKTWNSAATTRSSSTPWSLAAFRTRPPPATSAAASTRRRSVTCRTPCMNAYGRMPI